MGGDTTAVLSLWSRLAAGAATHASASTRAHGHTCVHAHGHTRRARAHRHTCTHIHAPTLTHALSQGGLRPLASSHGPAPGQSADGLPRGWTPVDRALLSLPGTAPVACAETRNRLRGQDSGTSVPCYLGISRGHPGRQRVMSSNPQTTCQRVPATWPLANGSELRGAFGSRG